MSPEPVSLIFDIGKTTKKALLFDKHFHVLEERTAHFNETKDDDGFPAENLSCVSQWVKDIFHECITNARFNVAEVNFSAYGASLVHLDDRDTVIEPFYNYLKPFPDHCRKKFLSEYNQGKTIQTETASPLLGLLNSGLQLYWLKNEKLSAFNRIKTSLHFPQYFIHLLTGEKFADITSVGCHTMLWDFQKKNYHTWVLKEGFDKMFPRLLPGSHTFDFLVGKRQVRFGIGVHDSSAALMPYLVTSEEPFLLLSTGTWNICFNPYHQEGLTTDELAKDCLCYLTHQGEPVKASRIFLGHEHEVQQKVLAKYFNLDGEAYKSVTFNERVYNGLTMYDHPSKQFYPLEMEGTGPMPAKFKETTDLGAFKNFEEAQHQLIRCLVQWQNISITLADPKKQIKKVIVVGGFVKNPLFLEILKRELPERKILVSDHPRAAALGAAWLVNDKFSPNKGTQELPLYAV